jgi:hypothetical protein
MLPFTVPIAYLIHQPDSPPIELTAAKVNLGINRLWFFDEQSNLLAVFRWEKISGLSVKGSAENQVIDGLPDNMQKVTSDAELEAEKGAVLAALGNSTSGPGSSQIAVEHGLAQIARCHPAESDRKCAAGDAPRRRAAFTGSAPPGQRLRGGEERAAHHRRAEKSAG